MKPGFNVEQDPVDAYAQPVLMGMVLQRLDIAASHTIRPLGQLRYTADYAGAILFRQFAGLLNGLGLSFDIIGHKFI
jgi:hypothetical protein